MTKLAEAFSRYFSEKPNFEFTCPQCKKGSLVPDQATFKVVEPSFSKEAHSHDAWDPDWITYRFSVTCECNRPNCTETSYVSGSGSVDQWYGFNDMPEFYERFTIRSFYPAPDLIVAPKDSPLEVRELLDRSFALYWVDTSAASNSLRASLEALLDELKIPRTKKTKAGANTRLTLHARLDIWSAQQSDYAELCFALKEVGNLGSHGAEVSEEHYFGALELFHHVLTQLYENNAVKMKALAKKIRSEIKSIP